MICEKCHERIDSVSGFNAIYAENGYISLNSSVLIVLHSYCHIKEMCDDIFPECCQEPDFLR